MNTSLNGIKFGIDSSGNYGYYKVGADTVTPFKTGLESAITRFSDYSGKKDCNPSSYVEWTQELHENWKVVVVFTDYNSSDNPKYEVIIFIKDSGKIYGYNSKSTSTFSYIGTMSSSYITMNNIKKVKIVGNILTYYLKNESSWGNDVWASCCEFY